MNYTIIDTETNLNDLFTAHGCEFVEKENDIFDWFEDGFNEVENKPSVPETKTTEVITTINTNTVMTWLHENYTFVYATCNTAMIANTNKKGAYDVIGHLDYFIKQEIIKQDKDFTLTTNEFADLCHKIKHSYTTHTFLSF